MSVPFDGETLDAYARDAFGSLVRIFLRRGFSEAAIRAGLDAALRSPPPVRELVPATAEGEVWEASHVLTLWHQEPEYVDAQGQPIGLKVRGAAPSFEALVLQVNPTAHVAGLLKYLREARAVRLRRRLVVPMKRLVQLRGIPGPATFRNIRGIAGMLRTNEHNLTPSDAPQGWFERNCENPRFPVSKLDEFAALLHLDGMGLLARFDEFMQRCEAARIPGEPTIWLGVGLYRYQEDHDLER